jgi:hypothetical protein
LGIAGMALSDDYPQTKTLIEHESGALLNRER